MRKKRSALALLFAVIIAVAAIVIVIESSVLTPSLSSVSNQQANVSWEKTYGGSGDDKLYYTLPTEDGYLAVGSSSSFTQGQMSAWVLKLDTNGNPVWNMSFVEGISTEFRYAINVNDGFLLVGNVFWPSGSVNGLIVKIDDQGNVIWNTTVGGEKVDRLFSAASTGDGALMVGLTNSYSNTADESSVWLAKIDNAGDLLWNESYGWSDDGVGTAITSTPDNCFIIAGYTNSTGAGDYDFLLMKVNSSGNMLWFHTYGGSKADMASAIISVPGGYLVAGNTLSFGSGASNALILKVDLNGTLIWDKTVGGTDYDMPTSIIASQYGGYIIGGWSTSYGKGERDFWIFQLDDNGTLQWSRTIEQNGYTEAYSTIELGQDKFLMAGWENDVNGKSKPNYYDYYFIEITVNPSKTGVGALVYESTPNLKVSQ